MPLSRHSNSTWRLPINWLPSKHQALRPSEPPDWSAFCIHDERRTTRVSSRDPVAFKPPRSPRARIEGGSTRAGPWSRRSGSQRLRARCGAGRLRCRRVWMPNPRVVHFEDDLRRRHSATAWCPKPWLPPSGHTGQFDDFAGFAVEIPRPGLHERPALLEQVRTRVGLLHDVAHLVTERRLG